MYSIPSGIVMHVKAEQYSKAADPIVVILLGISTLVRNSQLENVPSSIFVTPSGIVTSVRELQP